MIEFRYPLSLGKQHAICGLDIESTMWELATGSSVRANVFMNVGENETNANFTLLVNMDF